MSRIHNVWRELGYTENPFHTDALRAVEQDQEIYIPRPELESELGSWLASENRGGIFVEGAVGVGKTTLVNQTQLTVHRKFPEVLPCDDVVEIQDTTDLQGIVLDVCASILRALQDLRIVQDDVRFQEVEAHVRRTRTNQWNAGLTIAGTGVHGGRQQQETQPVATTLQALQEMLENLKALLTDQGFEKAVVCLNNLDNVDEGHLWGLLHDARDTLLQRNGLVFVFIGPPGLRAALASNAAHQRISDVLAQQVAHVGSLSVADTWAVLEARVAFYGGHKVPVGKDVVRLLYDASGGALRFVLNRIADIASHVLRATGHRGLITNDDAMAALRRLVHRDVEGRNLSPRKMEVLAAIVEAGQAQPRDFKEFGFNNAPALHTHLKDLAAAGLLERHTNPADAREAIYRPRGDAVLYFQGAAPG